MEESNKCCICGKELPINMTVMIISEDKGKFKVCCLAHEGTKEFNEQIKNERIG